MIVKEMSMNLSVINQSIKNCIIFRIHTKNLNSGNVRSFFKPKLSESLSITSLSLKSGESSLVGNTNRVKGQTHNQTIIIRMSHKTRMTIFD